MNKTILIMALVLAIAKGYAQKVEMEGGYAVFMATGLLAGTYETRPADFAPEGRIPRHGENAKADRKLSARFRIAPTDCNPDGTVTATKLRCTWAEAAGYNISANTLPIDEVPQPTETGCTQYKGKDNLDSEKGKWRLPTRKELLMICMCMPALKKMGVLPAVGVWSATEESVNGVAYCSDYSSILARKSKGSNNSNGIRCIQDIP